MATGTLNGTTIAATYKSLLKIKGGANQELDSTERAVEDGHGNDSLLYLSTTEVYSPGAGGNTGNTIFGKDAFNTSSNNDSDYNTFIGELAAGTGTVAAAINNVGVGYKALNALTSGDNNVCIGFEAGDAFDAESDNIFIGSAAGGGLVTVGETIAIGSDALLVLTGGVNNIAIGHEAMKEHTGGARNIAVGHGAMDETGGTSSSASNYNIAIGWNALGGDWADAESNYNVAIGSSAMDAVMDGALSNTGVGHAALGALEEGVQNTVLGYQAGDAITGTSDANNGSYNTCVGSNAGGGITTGSQNVAVGQGTMNAALTTNLNTAVGDSALNTLTGGANNVVVGAGTATNLTTGGNNTYIGKSCDASASDVTNETAVGYGITPPAGGNSVTLGNASVTEVYCSSDKGASLYAAQCVVTTGINFPDDDTANPSADVNTLDNYEEGTFTPVVKFGGSTETAGNSVGWYTKIGNLATVQIRWYADGGVDNTGNLTCTLPYTVNDASNFYVASAVWTNLIDFGGAPAVDSDMNTALITFQQLNASTSTAISIIDHSDCGSGFQFRLTYTFRTT